MFVSNTVSKLLDTVRAVSVCIAKYCYLTAEQTELHLRDGRPPLGYLQSPRRGGQPMKMQESFAFLVLGVGRLREDQFIYVATR